MFSNEDSPMLPDALFTATTFAKSWEGRPLIPQPTTSQATPHTSQPHTKKPRPFSLGSNGFLPVPQ